jgi:hypothetical protein
LAQRQVRSRYLNALIKMERYTIVDQLYNDGQTADYSHQELR